ncbi:hypothetical protein ANCDUO_03816 [Ancylostoma duodenale]|uniref:Uncharacterized protein n=1 Tax=Ancylostoma duodenale TaxID=51022 RepID=A0A0C2H8M8_9BILA|nr:hypothetical protein ANCDUO_03816 [Ancylostoma duodenale]
MGVTLKDEVSNEVVRSTFGVTPITDKMREARLRWFEYVQRTEGYVKGAGMVEKLDGQTTTGRISDHL